MKHLIILILVVIASLGVSFLIKSKIEKSKMAKISFVQSKHDFDTLRSQADADFYFVYENHGNKDLKIYDIKTSCGCTIPSWNDNFLRPYEKDSFKVTYNVANKGYFLKEIMIYSTSETSPDRIEVMGFVPFE